MLLLVRSVMRQTRARIFHGNTHVGDKIISVFDDLGRCESAICE